MLRILAVFTGIVIWALPILVGSPALSEDAVAIVRGRSQLEFTSDGKTYKNGGNYLCVLTKGQDGR